MPSALILIANGTEEMEFTIPFDTLVRAGVSCTSAFVPSQEEIGKELHYATCSRGVKIIPDILLKDIIDPASYDAIIIPGGAKGAETLSSNTTVQTLVKSYYDSKKVVGMICAGSLAAKTSGLQGESITSHPSVKEELKKDFSYQEESVVVSGKLVTSRGPGTAFPFAFKLVELLCGEEKNSGEADTKALAQPEWFTKLEMLARRPLFRVSLLRVRPLPHALGAQARSYAKSKRQKVDEDEDDALVRKLKGGSNQKLVPTSQNSHGDEFQEEKRHLDEKMAASVRWFKAQVALTETRTSGRATPTMLDSVRVELPDMPSQKLAEVATVGVKDLSTLLITAYEAEYLKHIERAIYDAELPGMTPQKVDDRTLKIPVPQPTLETRNTLVASLSKHLEEARVAIRKHHQTTQKKLKTMGFENKHPAYDEIQKLHSKHIDEMEQQLQRMKKHLGAK